jgi:hypothetical protein
MPLPLLAAAAVAGGQLMQGANQAGAVRRRNSILANGSREQSRAGMEATSAIGDFLAQLRGSAPNPAAERGMFTDAMRGAPGIAGPGGAQFQADAGSRTAGAQGYGTNLADLFARIRAPGLQRQNESQMMLGLNGRLRPIRARAEDEAFLTNLRAGMEQPNPWAGIVGQGLSNVGSYYLGKK